MSNLHRLEDGSSLSHYTRVGSYVVTNPAELPAGTYYVECVKGVAGSNQGFTIQRCTNIATGAVILRTTGLGSSYTDITDVDEAAVNAIIESIIGTPTELGVEVLTVPSSAELRDLTGGRIILTADTTYYVRSDGNDANTGLEDTADGAFLTLQGAVDYIKSYVDPSGYNVTIQVRAGTYAAANFQGFPAGTKSLYIVGDTTTPANVVMSGVNAILMEFVSSQFPIFINGFKFTGSTGNISIRATNCYYVVIGCDKNYNSGKIVFESANIHVYFFYTTVEVYGDITFTGTASRAFRPSTNATLGVYPDNITYTSATFTSAFIQQYATAITYFYPSAQTGTFTGSRFSILGGHFVYSPDPSGTVAGTISGLTTTDSMLYTPGVTIASGGAVTLPGGATLTGSSGAATVSGKLNVNSDAVRVQTAKTPSSATATGTVGDICWDTNYVYVCVATNTWKRSALATW